MQMTRYNALNVLDELYCSADDRPSGKFGGMRNLEPLSTAMEWSADTNTCAKDLNLPPWRSLELCTLRFEVLPVLEACRL